MAYRSEYETWTAELRGQQPTPWLKLSMVFVLGIIGLTAWIVIIGSAAS